MSVQMTNEKHPHVTFKELETEIYINLDKWLNSNSTDTIARLNNQLSAH